MKNSAKIYDNEILILIIVLNKPTVKKQTGTWH